MNILTHSKKSFKAVYRTPCQGEKKKTNPKVGKVSSGKIRISRYMSLNAVLGLETSKSHTEQPGIGFTFFVVKKKKEKLKKQVYNKV